MDFRPNTNSSIFTNRELRRYRSLYRSRNLLQAQRIAAADKRDVNITIYGSIALLSANIRPIIRKTFTNSSWHYKVNLFSNSLSQAFTSTSYHKERGSLLKGSSFYRTITFSIPSNQSPQDEFSYIGKQLSDIFKRFGQINKGVNASFSEVAYLNPILIYRATKIGVITPRRFSEARFYLNKQVSNLDTLGQHLMYINTPILKRNQLIIKPQLSILNKIFYAQLSILRIIQIIANKH